MRRPRSRRGPDRRNFDLSQFIAPLVTIGASFCCDAKRFTKVSVSQCPSGTGLTNQMSRTAFVGAHYCARSFTETLGGATAVCPASSIRRHRSVRAPESGRCRCCGQKGWLGTSSGGSNSLGIRPITACTVRATRRPSHRASSSAATRRHRQARQEAADGLSTCRPAPMPSAHRWPRRLARRGFWPCSSAPTRRR